MNQYMTYNDHNHHVRATSVLAGNNEKKTYYINNSNTSLPTSITRLRVSFSVCDTRMKVLAKKLPQPIRDYQFFPSTSLKLGQKDFLLQTHLWTITAQKNISFI